jgi:hypothetical protein
MLASTVGGGLLASTKTLSTEAGTSSPKGTMT